MSHSESNVVAKKGHRSGGPRMSFFFFFWLRIMDLNHLAVQERRGGETRGEENDMSDG